MGETLSTLVWEDGSGDDDDNDNAANYMDVERGDYHSVELREEEFYRMQYTRMAERFGTPDIDPRFFYGNCIRLERYSRRTGDTVAYCWMPIDHVIAKLLLCNPHLNHGLLEDTLHDCPMVGCLLEDADQIVCRIMDRFRHYGLLPSHSSGDDDCDVDTESPPSPTSQNDSDNGDVVDEQIFIPGFAPLGQSRKIAILDPNNPPPPPQWTIKESRKIATLDPQPATNHSPKNDAKRYLSNTLTDLATNPQSLDMEEVPLEVAEK